MKDAILTACKASPRFTNSIIPLFFLSSFLFLVTARKSVVASAPSTQVNNVNTYSTLPIRCGGYAYDDDGDDDGDDGDQFSEEYQDEYEEEEENESHIEMNHLSKESRNKKASSSSSKKYGT